MKIALCIEYDGSNYSGWQKQNDVDSIQGEIENALESIGLEKLDTSMFINCCQMNFQVDSGANVWAVITSDVLIFYVPTRTSVESVSGDKFESTGWGGMIINLNGKPCLCSPVYVCPQNPRNTFSLGALKTNSCFKATMLDTFSSLTLVDHHDNETVIKTNVSNGLDFVELQIMSFSSLVQTTSLTTSNSKTVPTINQLSSQLSNAVILSSRDHQNNFIFNSKVMSIIATYFVSLHKNQNPQTLAIRKMNELLFDCKPSRVTTYNIIPSSPSISSITQDTILKPLVASLSKSVLRTQSPEYIYQLLHLSLSHSSKSTN